MWENSKEIKKNGKKNYFLMEDTKKKTKSSIIKNL